MTYLTKFFSVFIFSFFISITTVSIVFAGTDDKSANYQLSVDFDLKKGLVIGTAKITIDPAQKLSLSLSGLTVTGTLLKDWNSSEKPLSTQNNVIIIPAGETRRELYISYVKKVSDSFENSINSKGIVLVSNWHPVPDMPMTFKLTASLPDRFTAVAEADHFPLQRTNNTVTATFSQPLYSLHFAAAEYIHKKRQVREGLFVHSLFFAEEQNLADAYLKAAAGYIKRYEKEISPFPYDHYVIVANRSPTGYGFPSYTLIGQMVLRLPFIKDTSLGHEILHSWFGNSVDVDYSQGNWCESLTSYLADHSYRREKGEGRQDRKEAITNYLSYVHDDTVIPLDKFSSASHNQPLAKARRAVGYTRGALLFHELKEKIGAQPFNKAIRLFYEKNKGKEASWTDLQESFEASSTTKLTQFFQERLHSMEIPSLKISNVEVTYLNNKPLLSFDLLQQTKTLFSLLVPIQIKSTVGVTTHKKFINDKETKVTLELENQPLEIIVDPEYSFLRELSPPELPAVWSRFLGSDKKLIILSSEDEREIFKPLLTSLDNGDLTLKLSDEVTNQELSENNLLFLGTSQNPVLSLFADPRHKEDGFTLDVRNNPLNPKYVAVLISSSDKTETDAVANRLNHYGKYSFLTFLHGRNQEKMIYPTESGIRVVLDLLPAGGKTSAISSFEGIIDELSKSRVIYVGETHTSLADHILQLRVIEALYARDPNLVIGMEMFPRTRQVALDQYVLGKGNMDEKTFLKESDYFNVWSYDYRYFRDIINFAKANSLPVLGLNLEKKIVSNVFRSGNTDNLDSAALLSLPVERDLDMEGYQQRLLMTYGAHIQGNHGKGNISGFLQAQALWDETMAENIANYLKSHPDKRMVVLAGSQHSRKDSGIPPRVKRRIDIKQSSVLNIYNSSSPMNLADVADYFFLSSASNLPETPKIGIVLTTVEENDTNYLEISQLSPHGKAGEAGLLKGDRLKAIDGFAIGDMGDLRIAMLDAKEGQIITITIIRTDGNLETVKDFDVELSFPPKSMMSP